MCIESPVVFVVEDLRRDISHMLNSSLSNICNKFIIGASFELNVKLLDCIKVEPQSLVSCANSTKPVVYVKGNRYWSIMTMTLYQMSMILQNESRSEHLV